MSDDLGLGKLITDDSQQRDAVHVAVVPVVAYAQLVPGQHVGLLADGTATAFDVPSIGIVDPFLAETVQKGDRFWLFLYPNTVTNTGGQFRRVQPDAADGERWRNLVACGDDVTLDKYADGTFCLTIDGINNQHPFDSLAELDAYFASPDPVPLNVQCGGAGWSSELLPGETRTTTFGDVTVTAEREA